MARKSFAAPVYESAATLFAAVTRGDSYVLSQRDAWSEPTANALLGLDVFHSRFAFRPTLIESLKPASIDVMVAAADALFLYHLFPYASDATNKIKSIDDIRNLIGSPFLPSRADRRSFGEGVGRVGSPYRRYMRQIFAYFVRFCEGIVGLDASDLISLAGVAVDVGEVRTEPGVSALLHLIDPDRYEPIVSGEHKRRIIERFADLAGRFEGEDEALASIRNHLIVDRAYAADFDWYAADVFRIWSTPDTDIELEDAAVDGDRRVHERIAWLEMSNVEQHEYKREPPYGTGYALISPVLDRNDADRYRFMREVRPGDLVLHLVNADHIASFSYVAGPYTEVSETPHHPAPDGPYYLVPLRDRTELARPLPIQRILEAEPYATRLRNIARSGVRHLFYQANGRVRQGAYLTPVIQDVFDVIEDGYTAIGGFPLSDLLARSGDDDTIVASTAGAFDLERETGQLAKQTLLPSEVIRPLLEALHGPSRHVILAGPPGTSKTHLAVQLAKHLTDYDKTRVELVQFHPGYSYEQFIEGIRPQPVENGVRYMPEDGVFVRFAKAAARAARSGDFILVIDEINRANLPTVLGELLFALEYRDEDVRLPYSGDMFRVPPNLRILATMNTADRSIRAMDVALRRRFEIFELEPDVTVLRRHYEQDRFTNEVPGLLTGFVDLNAVISETAGPQYRIGHATFMKPTLNRALVSSIFDRVIVPLLRQAFFEEKEQLEQFTAERFFWPNGGA